MKKLLWVLFGLLVVVLVALVSIPLFVNVNQYRSVITAEVNKKINGQIELGELSLSLWGAIKIHADSINLKVNGYPEPMLVTDRFHIEIPFLPILTGSPEVVAVLESPKIRIVKTADGKMNLMELIKKTPGESALNVSDTVGLVSAAPQGKKEEAPAGPKGENASEPATNVAASNENTNGAPTSTAVADSTPANSGPTKVPAIIAGATLGLDIQNGEVHYLDRAAKSEYHINNFYFEGRNLGLGSAMELQLKAPLKGESPSLSFEGPLEARASLRPLLVANSVKSVTGRIEIIASGLSVKAKNGSFQKAASIPLVLKAQFEGDDKETLIRTVDLELHDIKVNGKGRLTLDPMTAKMEISAEPVRLQSLPSLVPLLEAYQLKGLANFNSNINWAPSELRLSGDLKVSDGSFFLRQFLKAPFDFQLQMAFSENMLNIARAGISGPETELQLIGTVKNFLAPQFSFGLTGKSFNVDKTVVLPDSVKKEAASFTWMPVAYAAAPAAEKNPLADLAKNPILAKASGVFNSQIGKLTVYNTDLNQLVVKSALSNLVWKISEASFRTFDGLVKGNGQFDLGSPGLAYKSQGSVSRISAKEAFSKYFPKYQNTLEGNVDASWNVAGALFPAATRMKSLSGTAKLVAEDGALKSVDFQESINSAMKKIPFLKDKKPISVDDGFKTLTADLKFSGGVVKAEPIEVQPREKGFVVKGKSTIQESLEQESFFDVYDPQGRLPKELNQPGKPAIALRLYGPLTSPKTDYEYTVKKLASTAGKAAIKDAASKAIDKYLGGSQSGEGGKKDPLKDAADKLKKKFNFF